MRIFLKSKIHRAIVTSTNLEYDGSITIDSALMESANILPYEKVEVMNINTGSRFETYAIAGTKGEICLNGACARLAQVGDVVIILAYEISEYAEFHTPTIVSVGEQNEILARLEKRGYQVNDRA